MLYPANNSTTTPLLYGRKWLCIRYFWTNTAWFITLGLVTALQLALVLKKSGNRLKSLTLFFTFYGVTLLVETVLFIYLKAYDYYPKAFPGNQFRDSLFGNLFSQASIACSGLMIAFFDLNFLWVLAIIGGYFGVETAFVALGVYEHHWYRSWMTSIGLLILFPIYKRMFQTFRGAYGRVNEVVFRLLGFFTLNTVLFNWLSFVITDIFEYSTAFLPDPHSSWASVALFLCAFLFAVCYFAYETKGLVWKAALLVLGVASYYAFYRLGLYELKPGWFLPFALSTVAFGYASMAFLARFIRKADSAS